MQPAEPGSKPLAGRRAAVVCSKALERRLVSGLELLGAQVLVLPLLRIRALPDTTAIDAALDRLDTYDWAVFTSGYGVRFFLERMAERKISRDRLSGRHVCAVGPATSRALRQAGIRVSLVPDEFIAEGVLRALAARYCGLQNLAGLRFLIPRAAKARDILPRELAGAGAAVDIVPCYENTPCVLAPELREDILARPPELLVFTSSSGVTSFVSALGEPDAVRLLEQAVVAVIGPATAATLGKYGKQADVLPGRSSLPELLGAVGEHFRGEAAGSSRTRGR